MTRPAAVALAKEMRSAGWTCVDIQVELAKRGVVVSRSTAQRWSNPGSAERHRATCRIYQHRRYAAESAGRLGRVTNSPEYKLERLCALRAAGVSEPNVVIVMRLDFGDDLTRPQIRRAIELGRYPKRAPYGPRRAA